MGGVIYATPFATLCLPQTFDEYFANCIKSAERALIRKAIKNGFTTKQIDYDEYLDQITEINTSKQERCGKEMTEDYLHPKERDTVVKSYNPHVYTFGCFNEEGKLVAYYMFEKFTNFFHVVKGIGHADYLSFGIMNYLLAYSISELSRFDKDAEYLIYGTMSNDKKDGLSNFKRHAGCEQKHVFLRGDRQQMRALEHFNKTYKLHDDTALNLVSEYANSTLC